MRESRMASIISRAMGCAPMACRMMALPRKKACMWQHNCDCAAQEKRLHVEAQP